MSSTLRIRGAKTDLGLDMTWHYSFLPAGQTVDRLADTVFIDVGGRLEPGIIDHHHTAAGSRSSARLVVDHPAYVHEHLVSPWVLADRVAAVKGRLWNPTIATHRSPDFDAIVTTKLVQSLVESGRLPLGYEKLVWDADRVDSGFERPQLPEERFELYPLILMLQNVADPRCEELATDLEITPPPGQQRFCRDELILRLGLHLIDKWLAAGGKEALFNEDVLVRELAAEMEKDADIFRGAVARYRALEEIRVPASSGSPQPRRAAALIACQCDEVPCVCNSPWLAFDKIYLRSGFTDSSPAIPATPLTVIEKPRKAGETKSVTGPAVARHRWIVSIDPHVETGQPRVSLEGLGASLEWAEQTKRHEVLGGPDPRKESGLTRFPEYPGVSDPWYDGRGHQWTIVDTPNDGSVLTGDEVIGILSSDFWDPLLEDGRAWAWKCRAGSIEETVSVERNKLTPPCRSGPPRVGQFLADAKIEACDDYIVAVVRIRTGWATERFVEAIRDVVSGDPQPIQLICGTVYAGPHGTVVAVNPGMAFEPGKSIDMLLTLHHELLEIERHAASLSRAFGDRPDSESGATCQFLRKRFIRSAAEYRGKLATEKPDDRTLRLGIEEILSIDRRCDGTGAFLQLLDDEAQEMSEWRLNRLGLILAIMGVIQTIIAAFEALEASCGADFPLGPFRFHAVWATATFVLTAACAIFALSMVSRGCQRMYARYGIMRQFFPEHAVNRPGKRRGADGMK